MSTSLTEALIGRGDRWPRFVFGVLLGIVAFTVSFVGYAIGVFSIPGGIVWIPGDAALVGMAAALFVGYLRRGVLVAWLVTYASLLGYAAQRSLFGYSNTTNWEKLAYFFDPETLVVLALESLVLGVIAYTVGMLFRFGVDTYKRHSVTRRHH